MMGIKCFAYFTNAVFAFEKHVGFHWFNTSLINYGYSFLSFSVILLTAGQINVLL